MQRQTQTRKCPECGSPNLVRDEEMGEVICSECGLVISEGIINPGPEWRAFTPEERSARRRVGPPSSQALYDKGLSTTIRVGRDSSGRALSPETRYRMMRLRRWNIRSRMRTTFERNLLQAMNELELLCDKLQIPLNVKETAAVIYRRALKEDLVRGRSIAAVAAASLYAACRMTNTPRSLKEVAEASTRDKKEVARCYRLLLSELRLKMPIDAPIQYVSKIANGAGISQEVQSRAIEVLREAREKKLTVGKDPIGVAAAALYIAAQILGVKMTQKELAVAANVTEVTIRNRYKGLIKGFELASPMP
ncbi:MAG: transcription initiation factor IIB family protein [Candidatus Bathyarchaeia archaeon]